MLSTVTLPSIAAHQRIILVGDIHGCLEEFNRLLQETRYRADNDVLVLVGDLVNKGYDSIGVVKRAMQLKAHCVLGNHDATLIARYDHIREGEVDPSAAAHAADPITQTAKALPRECYKFLTELPHILKIPQFNIVVAHAGLNPRLPLEEQNLWELLHMRRVLPNGRVTDAQTTGEMWGAKWRGPETVVFGHDARAGLQKHPFAIGLDTGCCYGGDLTAYVLPQKQFVSVPGSKRGVSKKPPAATTSPATNIGFSPSTEVAAKATAAASGARTSGVPGDLPRGATNRLSPQVTPPASAAELTASLKSMLSLGGSGGKSASASPQGPLFPTAPSPSSVQPPTASESSIPQAAGRGAKRHSPVPSSATAGAPTGTSLATGLPPGVLQPPAGAVPKPRTQQPQVSSRQGSFQGSHQHSPVSHNSPLPPAPASTSANATNTGASGSSAIPKPNLPPTAAAVRSTNGTKPSVVKSGGVSPTAAPAANDGGLQAHVIDVAGRLLAADGLGAAALMLLSGPAVEAQREAIISSPAIPPSQWSRLVEGLVGFVGTSQCGPDSADEALGWVQDVAEQVPAALDAVDRPALLARVASAPHATRAAKRSTAIALR